jgi:broad specificity phosphatase PhoE
LEDASKLGERLRNPIAAIYSSDLGRARKTAEALSSYLQCPVKFDVRLRERHMDIFQGLTKEEIAQQHPDEWAEYRQAGSSYVIREGESADQRLNRTIDALRRWLRSIVKRRCW